MSKSMRARAPALGGGAGRAARGRALPGGRAPPPLPPPAR